MRTITRLRIDHWGRAPQLDLELHPGLNVLLGDSGAGKTLCLRLLHLANCDREARAGLLGATLGSTPAAEAAATVWRRDRPIPLPEAPESPEPLEPPPLYLPPWWPPLSSRTGEPALDPWSGPLARALEPPSLTRQGLVPVRPLLDLLRDALDGETAGEGPSTVFRIDRGAAVGLGELGEGARRLALLHLLLRNGSLGAGSLVLWDLPESGLALAQLHVLAKLLIGLVGSGAQVVLATHSYVLTKELSLIAEDAGAIRYHLLQGENGGPARSSETYELAAPNPPLEAHARLYDRSVRRALRGE